MAISQRRQNISMSDFRSEFKGTSSGSISMSELVREDAGANLNDVGGTRNAGNLNSSFASRLSNGQLPPHAVGVGHDLGNVPSAGTTPSYFNANPQKSTSNMAFSSYLGVSGSFPASKWGLAGYSGEAFSNSGSATGGYIARNIDYSNTVKLPGGSTGIEDGFNIHGGYFQHNFNGYRHIPLNTICAPSDIMFVITISNTGANVVSSGVDLKASNGTTGTFTTSSINSNNWTPNGTDFYEFQDGNDRNVFARAVTCSGGETHASIKFYSSGANSSSYHGYMVGVIRAAGNNSLTGPTSNRTNFSHIAASNNQEKFTQMGTIYGYGELVILVAMSGHITNNPATNYNTNSNHMIKGELSNSSGLGPFAFSAGIYEEGITTDLKTSGPSIFRPLYVTSNPTDGLIFVARFQTKA